MTQIHRKTKETDIRVTLDMRSSETPVIETPLPFFNHILYSMAFHGQFTLKIEGSGDIEVDPHHFVEDAGLVLGQALAQETEKLSPIARYGYAIIPMDDALCEAVMDNCGRPFLQYNCTYPQAYAGNFDISLLKEFFLAIVNKGNFNLHLISRYGENSHHIAEAVFKSFGRALSQTFKPVESNKTLSTKGIL